MWSSTCNNFIEVNLDTERKALCYHNRIIVQIRTTSDKGNTLVIILWLANDVILVAGGRKSLMP